MGFGCLEWGWELKRNGRIEGHGGGHGTEEPARLRESDDRERLSLNVLRKSVRIEPVMDQELQRCLAWYALELN